MIGVGKLKSISPRLSGLDAKLPVMSGVPGSARANKGSSSTARGYGYRWQQERAAFLAANPLCMMCSKDLSPVTATVVDHKIPHGGNEALFWDKKNWQALCKHCHDSVKQRAEHSARRDGGVKSSESSFF